MDKVEGIGEVPVELEVIYLELAVVGDPLTQRQLGVTYSLGPCETYQGDCMGLRSVPMQVRYIVIRSST